MHNHQRNFNQDNTKGAHGKMYAKITNGSIEEYSGGMLQYTKTENGTMYYIQIINPDEQDLNDAGYYRVVNEGEETKNGVYTYIMVGNKIIKREIKNEKAFV